MWELFKDKNEINEKNVIGFASFVLMVMFAITDLVTGFCGQELVINNTIYNSFVIITLGCFGISSFEKIKKLIESTDHITDYELMQEKILCEL